MQPIQWPVVWRARRKAGISVMAAPELHAFQ
jgi:hypothetical protein